MLPGSTVLLGQCGGPIAVVREALGVAGALTSFSMTMTVTSL
jgi:hypothetical protein